MSSPEINHYNFLSQNKTLYIHSFFINLGTINLTIMKTKATILFLILTLGLSLSCRVKNNCELNHTGTIIVTNNLTNDIEVYVDNLKVFSLKPNETKETEKPVGKHNINCYYEGEEWSYTADVFECEKVTITVP